jgi:ABC-type dipeptide/oligopeptide/nickel transport system permease component
MTVALGFLAILASAFVGGWAGIWLAFNQERLVAAVRGWWRS